MRKLLSLAVIGGLLFLAGCGQGRGFHTITAAGVPLATVYTGAVTATTYAPTSHMTIAAPSPADAQAALANVTPEQAFTHCGSKNSSCLGNPDASSTEFLARVTSETAMPDVLKDRLVYVIKWTGYKCFPNIVGPETPKDGYDCTYMTFIDAQTGEDLGAVSGPSSIYDPNTPEPVYPSHSGKAPPTK